MSKNEGNQPRDVWSKIEIFVTPVTVALVGIFGQLWLGHVESNTSKLLAQIQKEATIENRELDVMRSFQSSYCGGNPDARRLSTPLIRLCSDEQNRRRIREFVMWDALERNIKKDFVFEEDNADWHLLGEVLLDWGGEDPLGASEFWNNLRQTALTRWTGNSKLLPDSTQLSSLFEWVQRVYAQGWLKSS